MLPNCCYRALRTSAYVHKPHRNSWVWRCQWQTLKETTKVFATFKSAAIISQKPSIPPSAAAMHWLSQRRCPSAFSRGIPDVSEAEIRACSQYLCLRIRADGEGDRLSRI